MEIYSVWRVGGEGKIRSSRIMSLNVHVNISQITTEKDEYDFYKVETQMKWGRSPTETQNEKENSETIK